MTLATQKTSMGFAGVSHAHSLIVVGCGGSMRERSLSGSLSRSTWPTRPPGRLPPTVAPRRALSAAYPTAMESARSHRCRIRSLAPSL